jgi:hypothetical protein
MKLSISNIFGKIFLISLFILVTGVTLLIAYGYKFNIDLQSVQKTSIIDIVKPDTEAQVYLDSELIEESLPTQLTSVLPGNHEVTIIKEGFFEWRRNIKVQEDIVSIVKDVLLIPKNISNYKEELMIFSEDEIVLNGFDYFLVYTPESRTIRMIFLGDKGSLIDDNIDFFHSDFEVIENYPHGGLLLRVNDATAINDLYAYMDFSKNQFSVFSLPENIRKINIDVVQELVFYLRDDNLFSVSFEDLDQGERQEIEHSVLRENIEDYDIDDAGHLYFISNGILYLMGSDQDLFLDKSESPLKYISFYKGNGYGMVIDMDEAENRSLFVINGKSILTAVTNDLYGKPYMNYSQQIVYANLDNNIFLYDILEQENILINHIDGDFYIHGWFDDDHYLIEKEGKLFIADLYNANKFEIIDDFNAKFLHAKDSALFYLENNRLMRINVSSSL